MTGLLSPLDGGDLLLFHPFFGYMDDGMGISLDWG